MDIHSLSPFAGIVLFSLLGGALSLALAGLLALSVNRNAVPMLVSYAIGAMLAAVFLDILPHALESTAPTQHITATVLGGILLFFALEKLVIWRHCHGDHCEVHAPHDEAHCPDNAQTKQLNGLEKPKFKRATTAPSMLKHAHTHAHDDSRSGMMIMIGDTFHNFVDGVLIASAFLTDIKLGVVVSLAMIAHEIPQELGDFLILLHSGYSKQKALWFNFLSSLATLLGGVLAYYFFANMQNAVPYILAIAASSMLYVAVSDLIPSLHKRTETKASITQLGLILLGVSTILLTQIWLD